jgi:hypothetical protein
MKEFRQYIKETVGTIAWQDAAACKAAAKDIMDHFEEDAGNMSRSIIMNGIYQGLYAGFDAISDTLQEKGIDGSIFWNALQDDLKERYSGKQLVMQLADFTVVAQEARNYNDQAYQKFKSTNGVDEALIGSAVECLVKMRPWLSGQPLEQQNIDPDLGGFCKKICAAMFANTFRQLNLEMYQKDEFHVLFLGLYKDFSKSTTIIQEFGEDVIASAQQLTSRMDDKSQYKKLYQNYCQAIQSAASKL